MGQRCSSGEIPSVARDPYNLRNLKEQILPLRVTLCEQCELLFSPPFLNLLLAIGSYGGIAEGLVVHQSMDFVFSCEAIKRAILMFLYALPQIVSKAHVQRAAHTCEQIDEVAVFCLSRRPYCCDRHALNSSLL